MTTATHTDPATADGRTGRTRALRRMSALGRAELTLLTRNRAALFNALLVPTAITFGVRNTVADMDLSSVGLSLGTMLLPGAIGFVLLFALYANLVVVYVSRREEKVLKRLRTGELRDSEIMGGAALPSLALSLAQCALLVVGGVVLLDVAPPEQPALIALGLLLGLVLMVAAAAATTAFTGSTEGAQLTPMPLMLVSFALSGLFVPPEVMPDTLAAVAAWLPLSPVMELLRGGWTGGADLRETGKAAAIAVLWIALAATTVRRRFRWEPRK